MDPSSSLLEDLDLDGFLFGSQDKQHSMDLDAGLSGVSLPELDEGRLALHLDASMTRFPGHDLVSAALRAQPDAGSVPLTVSDKDIRPSAAADLDHVTASSAQHIPSAAAGPAAVAQVVPPPAAQFTIRPMPARKTACKPVVVVKAEPEVDQQALQAQQLKQQQQQQQLQQLQEEVDAAAFDSDSEDPSSAHGGGKRRRRMRNAKQQELNRLAQQRYRERRKQKYSTLQDTVEELSTRLGQLSTLEAANSELHQRNNQLEVVVKDQNTQLMAQKDTITRQAQQLQTQAVQLSTQAKQLQAQVSVIQQQDKTLQELRSKLGTDSSSVNNAAAPGTPTAAAGGDADQLNDQIAMAVRAVLTGVSSMASVSFPPAKDAAQMQQMVVQLPDALLQQIRSCCREVALHLKKTEVKEQPHAISVPCC